MCDLFELGISVRSFNALYRGGIRSINDLLIYIVSGKDLCEIKRLGKASKYDILENTLSFLKQKSEADSYDV